MMASPVKNALLVLCLLSIGCHQKEKPQMLIAPVETANQMLRRGISEHNKDVVAKSIAEKADLNAISERQTPVTFAIYQGFDEIVDVLLHVGAAIDAVNEDKNSPLMVAIIKENPTMINQLLVAGANVNVGNFLGDTPLHFAVRIGDINLVRRLLTLGANPDAENRFRESPRLLVARLAEKPALSHPNILAMSILINHGDDTAAAQHDANSLLWQGLVEHKAEIIQQALVANADVNVLNVHETPLIYAIRRDVDEGVALLMQAPAIQIDLKNGDYDTPLVLAIIKQKVALVTELVNRGADVNSTDRGNTTPLHMAVDVGNLAIVQMLVAHGATPDVKNSRKLTAKLMAKRRAGKTNASDDDRAINALVNPA